MLYNPTIEVPGLKNGLRVESRVMEELLQQAVDAGHRCLEVHAYGQHGLGGRLWKAAGEEVLIRVLGASGQRLGSMGFPGTLIEAFGPVSDDVGWLNAGAQIIVHGHATNGVGNAMAQGKIYIAGDIGARGMTMTKKNPRFEAPELWVLGGVGDSFAEFMAGGIAVICGHDTSRSDNVLGYRPGVGMVGGKIFFRGPHHGFSQEDTLLTVPDDEEWQWLLSGLDAFLKGIARIDLYALLTADRSAWQLLTARKPYEKTGKKVRTMKQFRTEAWDGELGRGGLIGDLTAIPDSTVAVLATGEGRRFIPRWENGKYLPPCQAHCPSGIPVRKRWELIRRNQVAAAVDLALEHTPFPATVCGYLCPNLCMQNCSRPAKNMPALDVALLGKASLEAKAPAPAPPTGKKIAVIGGGAAGLSVAWQLWRKGHTPVIHEMRERLGGKITATIPRSRIPDEVLEHELARVQDQIRQVHRQHELTRKDFQELLHSHDFVVIATGAQQARTLPVPGQERAVPALDFLRQSKEGRRSVSGRVVIIGAGNVGCDAAAEAFRLGAQEVTLIDIQEPASFGAERKQAEQAGAKFLWPRFTQAITDSGVQLTDGTTLPAELVIMALGDQPRLSFLPADIELAAGFIRVNAEYQTSHPRVFAIGDVVRPGLLTEAIGAGRLAARKIDDLLQGRHDTYDQLPAMDPRRVHLEYYDPGKIVKAELEDCSAQCASCGACRDCGLCETICPQQAIARQDRGAGDYEYTVDPDRCIGCGFCAGACPCGIWEMAENTPLEGI